MAGIKVGLTSYPLLWQRLGGLQIQIQQTRKALILRGGDAAIVDWNEDSLTDYDLLHVFGLLHGNDKIVKYARDNNIPVVVSSVQAIESRYQMYKVRLASNVIRRFVGRRFGSVYDHIKSGLENSDAIIALGEQEKRFLEYGYGIPGAKIDVIPNGISDVFFSAKGGLFREYSGIREDFILQVSSVSPYKNVAVSSKLSARLGMPLVLIGHCPPDQERYLNECIKMANDNFKYIGPLDSNSELLASAYREAAALVLPSVTEVMPLVVLEALAAGTPVVMTSNSSLEVAHAEACIKKFPPTDFEGMYSALREMVDDPPDGGLCKNFVKHLSWDLVSEKLMAVYNSVLP